MTLTQMPHADTGSSLAKESMVIMCKKNPLTENLLYSMVLLYPVVSIFVGINKFYFESVTILLYYLIVCVEKKNNKREKEKVIYIRIGIVTIIHCQLQTISVGWGCRIHRLHLCRGC